MPESQRRPGAHFECDFVLIDPRVKKLPPAAWTFYSKLWVLCVHQRREVICTSRFSQRIVSSLFFLSRNALLLSAKKCADIGLIGMTDHYYKVPGVKKLHSKMKWLPALPCCIESGCNLSQSADMFTRIPEPEPEPEPEPVPEPDSADDYFAQFWSLYPRKIGKQAALKKWKVAIKSGATADALICSARNYARAREGKEFQYTLHAATFLGPQERWRDYVDGIPEDDRPRDRGQVNRTPEEYEDGTPEYLR